MESPRAAREARRPKTAAAAAVRRAAAGWVEMGRGRRGSDGTSGRFDRVDWKPSGWRRGEEKSADRAHLSDNGIRLGRETGRARVPGGGASAPPWRRVMMRGGVLDASAHHGRGAASAGRALRAGLDDRRPDPGAGGGGHGERHVTDGWARRDERGARGVDESRRGTATRDEGFARGCEPPCGVQCARLGRDPRGSRIAVASKRAETPDTPAQSRGWVGNRMRISLRAGSPEGNDEPLIRPEIVKRP